MLLAVTPTTNQGIHCDFYNDAKILLHNLKDSSLFVNLLEGKLTPRELVKLSPQDISERNFTQEKSKKEKQQQIRKDEE